MSVPSVEERVAEVGGRPVHYRVAGDGSPVVLVHGLSGSTRWWTPVLPALVERHRVYLVDLPGFGAMRRARMRFALADAAGWLLAWSRVVGLRRVDLVGHSMGAAIALRAAVQRPASVRRLALIAPAGLRTDRSPAGHAVALLLALRETTPRFLPVLVRDAARAGPRTMLRAISDLLADDVRHELRRVAAPTLLVFGARDPLVPAALGQIYRAELPNAHLLVLDGAGHVPMFERSGDLGAALLDFLDDGIRRPGPPSG